ncbi:MAG: hypothetical protein KA217_04345 [Gammaproteobacteria bacterium]|nr:hypothetical protein [Gammaproteobacteria bacterium]
MSPIDQSPLDQTRRYTLKAIASLVLLVSLPASPTAAAPPEGKGKPDKAGKGGKGGKGGHQPDAGPETRGAEGPVRVSIGREEARSLALAQGYTGYASLPPGIRKNLARGKPLPPGIAKKVVPGPMLARLPSYPGHEWTISGTDLLLVTLGTAIVAEVLEGVFD